MAAFLDRLPEVTDLIAADSVIGGNVWLTTSVPAHSRVTLSRDQVAYEITRGEQAIGGARRAKGRKAATAGQ